MEVACLHTNGACPHKRIRKPKYDNEYTHRYKAGKNAKKHDGKRHRT